MSRGHISRMSALVFFFASLPSSSAWVQSCGAIVQKIRPLSWNPARRAGGHSWALDGPGKSGVGLRPRSASLCGLLERMCLDGTESTGEETEKRGEVHFVNLSNGAESLPLLYGIPVGYCRIQSSHCNTNTPPVACLAFQMQSFCLINSRSIVASGAHETLPQVVC